MKGKRLLVNTIYPAFMGEVNCHGIGVPCTFVRLAGCNLRCYLRTKECLCDTPEALEGKTGKVMSVAEIVNDVLAIGRHVVCVTGGEPLMQDCKELFEQLTEWGFEVVVETNGSKPIFPYVEIKGVSFVVDYKTSSTGETEEMIHNNYHWMRGQDFLKFVIDTEEDYNEMKQWVIANGSSYRGNIGVGLFWGSKMTYQELMKRLHEDDIQAYLNMQTHKMCCLYDAYKDDVGKVIVPKDL